MSNINSSFGNRAATQVTFFPTADISAINVQEAIVEVSNEKANINHTHTASDVGLGNVTNESKTTMFTNPTFTGTATATTFSGELNGNASTATNSDTLDGKHASDFALKSTITNATLSAASWTGTSAPYSYSLTVSGVTATSNQELLPTIDATKAQLDALLGANIQDGGQSSNTITLKAWGTKPTVDLPIRVVLRGDM